MNKFEKSLQFIKKSIQHGSPFYEQVYLVGGCVRDELLGERYSDLDLLINLPNGQREFVNYMCATYPDICKGPFYYQRYGTTAMDIIIDGSFTLVECVEPHVEEYDADGVTLLETRFCSLNEDSSRRDYTCNALYKNLHTDEILDPTGRGVKDLKDRLLITPSEPGKIYRQDPVRMLRGIRFKHQKNFRLDPDCWNAICQNSASMAIAAPKRLRDELNKMLKSRTFGEGINDLYISGLLPYVMPGMEVQIASAEQYKGAEEGNSLWQLTRMALATLTREHPHTDTLYKLAVLMMRIGLVKGRDTVAEILVNSGIGKERVISILHIIDQYKRFTKMYEGENYVARPRELPHFINALAKHKDDFRRMVRALNQGMEPAAQLPWRIFYDEDFTPKSKPARKSQSRRRTAPKAEKAEAQTPAVNPASTATSERNHKRNLKRREQRKRARARAKSMTPTTAESAPAEVAAV